MSFSLLISSLAIVSMAQSTQPMSLEQTLQICARIQNPVDRLACFEGLAAAAKDTGAADGENAAQPFVLDKAGSPDQGAGKTAGNPAEGGDSDAKSRETVQSVEKPISETGEAAAPADDQVERAGDKSESTFVIMRTDQLEEEKKKAANAARLKKIKPEPFSAKVLKAWRYSATDEQYIALENGQIWKKTDRKRGRTIKNGLEVSLEPGRAGGWLMKFNDRRPALRVRLVK